MLSHYRAVVWYTGDNERTIEPDQMPTGAGSSKLADDEFREVRAFLNEGGKLLYSGEKAGFNLVNQYVFNVEDGPPYCDSAAAPCIPLSNDFLQYYLGAFENSVFSDSKEQMSRVTASLSTNPFAPKTVALNGAGSADNQDAAYSMSPTSSVLPPDEYPLFRSEGIAEYSEPGPLAPRTGDFYMYSQQADAAYKRLTRTVDLTDASSGAMRFQTSFDLESDYDYMFVEARTAGQDDWTTLPDVNGNTSTEPGASCSDGWSTPSGDHPFLSHYMTRNPDGSCTSTGTTGEWNAATGKSDGYQTWEVDLSEFAGEQVEVSIAYATDPFVQELGTFVDDAEVVVDGQSVASTSFEDGLGGFTVGGPPEGSEPNGNNWTRSEALFEEFAGIKTEDTVYFGFGLEGIRSDADRADVMRRSLQHLGVVNPGGPGGGGPGGGGPGAGGDGGDQGGVLGESQSRRSLGLRSRTLRVGRSRRFKVALRCPPSAGRQCRGLLRVVRGKNIAARKSFRVKAGVYRGVKLRMARRDFRKIVRRGKLRYRVVLVTRDDAGTLRRKAVRMPVRLTRAARRAARST